MMKGCGGRFQGRASQALGPNHHCLWSRKRASHTAPPAAFADMLTPSDDINYNFVAGAYFFASLLCGALSSASASVERQSGEGFWIFAPFVPCRSGPSHPGKVARKLGAVEKEKKTL